MLLLSLVMLGRHRFTLLLQLAIASLISTVYDIEYFLAGRFAHLYPLGLWGHPLSLELLLVLKYFSVKLHPLLGQMVDEHLHHYFLILLNG